MHTKKLLSTRRNIQTLLGCLLIVLSGHACEDSKSVNGGDSKLGQPCPAGDCGDDAYCCGGFCLAGHCLPGQGCYQTSDCNFSLGAEQMVCDNTCKIKTGVDELSCLTHDTCLSGNCQNNKCVAPNPTNSCAVVTCIAGQVCSVNPSSGIGQCHTDCSKMGDMIWSWHDNICIPASIDGCNNDNECEEGYICNANKMCEEDAESEDPCKEVTCGMDQICGVNPSSGMGQCHTDCSIIPAGDMIWSWPHNACISADLNECDGDGDCEEGYSCNADKICEEDIDEPEFKFVRIDDLSPVEYTNPNREDPGVDIDAVVLVKKGTGVSYYAVSVWGYARGDDQSGLKDNVAFDPSAALGRPDAFVNYPSNTDICNYYVEDPKTSSGPRVFTFVSLGGLGGWLILEMGAGIEAGDKLDVLEVSDCKLAHTNTSNGQTALIEKDGFKVQISMSDAASGKWNVVNQGTVTKGVLTTTITHAMVNP